MARFGAQSQRKKKLNIFYDSLSLFLLACKPKLHDECGKEMHSSGNTKRLPSLCLAAICDCLYHNERLVVYLR